MDPRSFRPTEDIDRKLAAMQEAGFGNVTQIVNSAIELKYMVELGTSPAIMAKARVSTSPQLVPHAATIFADWNEGDEHWRWIASAPVAEIVAWAEVVEGDKEQVQP